MTNQSQATATQVHLDRIGQVALTVSDLPRAKDFYQNTLGMRFLFEAGTMAFFQCGEIRLLVGLAEKVEPRLGTILYFKVDNIHAVHETLLGKNVEFVDAPHLVARMPDHELWMTFLKDPEGNVLGLMSEVRPA